MKDIFKKSRFLAWTQTCPFKTEIPLAHYVFSQRPSCDGKLQGNTTLNSSKLSWLVYLLWFTVVIVE